MVKQILIVTAAVVFVLGVFYIFFKDFDTTAMDMHGWIAMALGVTFSIVLGVILMVLVFISARRGYDDRVDNNIPDQD